MFLSVFDIFKIGIGPSSSHTVGPMIAAGQFVDRIRARNGVTRIKVRLHGSLAFTGKGHGTDRAIQLGLCGAHPKTIQPDKTAPMLEALKGTQNLSATGLPGVGFDAESDIAFDYGPALANHANGMVFTAIDDEGQLIDQETYFSVGGGFVVTAQEWAKTDQQGLPANDPSPYPFATADQMLARGQECGLSIADMKRANEAALGSGRDLDAGLDELWLAMDACMTRGLAQTGTLPGGLSVKRRAADIYNQLVAEEGANSLEAHRVMDWLSVYAMAVNEENAAGGRVVTAPTNGAAGVIPAVIRYYKEHCRQGRWDGIREFLLTSAAIGGIIKQNASISGAEMGCQGEVGSASAMAAAGLAAALGGTNAQIENAAEMALEHHLGMTCDPIGGLVQVPCIERNAFGAVKAVTAASMALRGDGNHLVSLDQCVETMRQTGRDMNVKYKETSKGGLAVNVVAC